MDVPVVVTVPVLPVHEPEVLLDPDGDIAVRLGSITVFLRPDVAEEMCRKILAKLVDRRIAEDETP